MCHNCQAPNKHFTDGSQSKSRDLPSSKEQGTSPDWGDRSSSASGGSTADSDGDSRAVATGKRRAAELFSNASDPNWLGI